MKIIVLNCGSSSIKYQLFDMTKKIAIAKGLVDKIGLHGSYDSLPYLKAEIFVHIDSVIDEIQAEETKKARKKG